MRGELGAGLRLLAMLAAVGMVFVAAVMFYPRPAAALMRPGPSICGERSKVVESLEGDFGEVQRGYGVMNGKIVELFVGEDGVWTMLLTDAAGISCLVSMGDAWTFVEATGTDEQT